MRNQGQSRGIEDVRDMSGSPAIAAQFVRCKSDEGPLRTPYFMPPVLSAKPNCYIMLEKPRHPNNAGEWPPVGTKMQ
jgi:hypothetical protein